MNIAPREEFLTTALANDFAEIIQRPSVQAAIRVALNQFALDQARGKTWEEATRQHYELEGAKAFAKLLSELVVVPQKQAVTDNTNLKWNPPQSRRKPRPPAGDKPQNQ